jgi:hypothetical protein
MFLLGAATAAWCLQVVIWVFQHIFDGAKLSFFKGLVVMALASWGALMLVFPIAGEGAR